MPDAILVPRAYDPSGLRQKIPAVGQKDRRLWGREWPDVDSTLRLIAQWKDIIATDMTSAFYQIPLSCDSMKCCEVAIPFRGVRVYA